MNIGILGWWRASNQGDLAIRESLERGLAPHRVVPIDLPFEVNDDEIARLNLLDFLILGGGGLFQSGPCAPFDTFDQWSSRLTTPIGVVGLGIDEVLPRHEAAVHALADKSSFAYVRDCRSQQLMGHPKVKVAPDVTFLYPFPHVRPSLNTPSICGVNVRQLAGLDISRWVDALRDLPVRWRGIPFSNFTAIREVEILRQVDPACAPRYDPELFRGLDLLVGMAFHSVLFAVQAGIPVVAIAGTEKVRRFMRDIGLDKYVLEPDAYGQLSSAVGRALANSKQLRTHLQAITAQFRSTAQRTFADIHDNLPVASAQPSQPQGKASILVLASTSERDTRDTLASCLAQTHGAAEIVLVDDGTGTNAALAPELVADVFMVTCPKSSNLAERLNRAVPFVTGEYISWIHAGDEYAYDAIAYMAEFLNRNPHLDMVYTDYYGIFEADRLADVYTVDRSWKLFRGNVVGPSFMLRRSLLDSIGPFDVHSPLPDYDFWLRAPRKRALRPLHSAVFFQRVSHRLAAGRDEQAKARRLWYSALPPFRGLLWRIADSNFAAHYLANPLIAGKQVTRSIFRSLKRWATGTMHVGGWIRLDGRLK